MSSNIPTSIDPLSLFHLDSLAQCVYRDLYHYFSSVPAEIIVRTVNDIYNVNYLKVHVLYIELYESEAARYPRELGMIGVVGVGDAKEARVVGKAGEMETTAKANQNPRETKEAVQGSNKLMNLLEKNRAKKLSITVNDAPGESRILLECEEKPGKGDFFLDVFAPLVDRSVEEILESVGKPKYVG